MIFGNHLARYMEVIELFRLFLRLVVLLCERYNTSVIGAESEWASPGPTCGPMTFESMFGPWPSRSGGVQEGSD